MMCVFVIVMAATRRAACRPRVWPTGGDPLTLESPKSGLDVGHFYLAARLSFAGPADAAAVLQTWYFVGADRLPSCLERVDQSIRYCAEPMRERGWP